MSSIKAICRAIVDCEDKLTAAKVREASGRDDKIAKEVEIATLEQRLVQWTAARTAWIEGGRDIWLRAMKQDEVRVHAVLHQNGTGADAD